MSRLPFAKKSLGQHWLTDRDTLDAMVASAKVAPGDYVLEIGPGTGTLTERLLSAGAEVLALEVDHQRIKQLERTFHAYDSTQLFIQEGDIRKLDFSYLPDAYKIVANIPYYLTANLLRRLVDEEPKPKQAALLVQKEVAERVAASPGKLTPVAIFTQIYYGVGLGSIVPAALFTPPPKVDSQILILKRRAKPLIQADKNFFTVVNAGFSEPRKKLRSSLSSGLRVAKSKTEDFLTKAGINPDKRAQELTLDEWQALAQAVYPPSNT